MLLTGGQLIIKGIGVDYKLALQDTGAKDADGAFMNGTIPACY